MADTKSNDPNELAVLRTKMAFDRTRRSSERTLMAWIRTSLAMISFGFSIDTFFRTLIKLEGLTATAPLVEPMLLGLVLVGLGVVVLCLGMVEHFLYIREIEASVHFLSANKTWTYMQWVSLFIVVIGILIFLYMMFTR
jgi:uncharacterized membrane protein YidH (DUF202 family)